MIPSLIFSKSILNVDADSEGFTITAVRELKGGGATDAESIEFDDGNSLEIYVNRNSQVRLTWPDITGVSSYEVLQQSGSSEISLGVTSIEQFVFANTSDADNTYEIFIRAGGFDSAIVSINVDNTAPGIASDFRALDDDDTEITGESPFQIFSLSWDAATDAGANLGESVAYYEIRYLHKSDSEFAVPSANKIESTSLVDTNLNLYPSDISDGTVTYRIYSYDKAGNRSTSYASLDYRLNTSNPTPPTNIKLFNTNSVEITGEQAGPISHLSFNFSSSTDVTSYEVLVQYPGFASFPEYRLVQALDVTDGTIFNSSTKTATLPENFFSGVIDDFDEGDRVRFRVVAIDSAGNKSNPLEKTVQFDSTPPAFDILYYVKHPTPSNTLISVDGNTVNIIEQQGIVVRDNLNDIAYYSINDQPRKEGNRIDLEEELKARDRSDTGVHTVRVYDIALNEADIVFTMMLTPPQLPVNKNVGLTAEDEDKNLPGIFIQSASGLIEFAASADVALVSGLGSGTYRAFINGRPVSILESLSNVEQIGDVVRLGFSYTSALFGDADLLLEVQAIDRFGNISLYNIEEATIKDISQPFARILSTSSTSNSISAVIELQDYNNSLTSAGAEAVLYDGSTIVDEILLNEGTFTYTFEDLGSNKTNYSIRVIGSYKMDDQDRVDNATLNLPTDGVNDGFVLETLPASADITAEFVSSIIQGTRAEFDISFIKSTTAGVGIDFELFTGIGPYSSSPVQSKELDLSTETGAIEEPIVFSNLVPGTRYHLNVLDGNDVIATTYFLTNVDVPSATLDAHEISEDQAILDVTLANTNDATLYIFDSNGLISIDGIALNQQGGNRVTVRGLSPNTSYSAKVLTNYDLYIEELNGSVRNSDVEAATIGEFDFMSAKRAPSAEFISALLEIDSNNVEFRYVLEDPDNALEDASVVLYLNREIVQEIAIDAGRDTIEFKDLQSNTTYYVSIDVTYNLNNNEESISKFYIEFGTSFEYFEFQTIKSPPLLDIIDVERTNTSITLILDPKDEDESFVEGVVRIFEEQGSFPVTTFQVSRKDFDKDEFDVPFFDLDENTNYRIDIVLDYDLENGDGTESDLVESEFYRTRELLSTENLNVTTTSSSIDVSIDVYDYSNQTTYAQLFIDREIASNQIELQGVNASAQFDNLLPNTLYQLVIYSEDDDNVIIRRDVRTNRLPVISTPEITMNVSDLMDNRVIVSAVIEDASNVVTDNITIVITDEVTNETQRISRTKAELIGGSEVDLSDYSNPTISLSVTYDNNGELLQLNTDEIVVVNLDVEPEPEPEPEPDPEPTPPMDSTGLSMGEWILILVSVGIAGFIGVFIYSFRSVYLR